MGKRKLSALWLALIVAFLALSLPAWGWTGKVVKVADGDTITVLQETRQVKIRLYGIDCPEKRQAFGRRAKLFTSNKVFGKTVEVEPVDLDRYGRTVAVVRIEHIVLNEKLIEEGLAWVYLRYCHSARCLHWERLQARAQQRKLGLWQDPRPVAPWEFRKNKRLAGK
jgi:micrococcal nuclease